MHRDLAKRLNLLVDAAKAVNLQHQAPVVKKKLKKDKRGKERKVKEKALVCTCAQSNSNAINKGNRVVDYSNNKLEFLNSYQMLTPSRFNQGSRLEFSLVFSIDKITFHFSI